jgi:HAD superfamily hydrolase (TIGR01459 family)
MARRSWPGARSARVVAPAMAEPTRFIRGIEPLVACYDGFLIDQFGVLHDGRGPAPGVLDALGLLKAARRRVVLLSNSGRRSVPNEERLSRIGIPRTLYERVITSGETAWQDRRSGSNQIFQALGPRCLLFSRGGDRTAVDGLDLELVDDAGRADFVLLSGLDADAAMHARCRQALEAALARRLVLICTNPDLVSIDGEQSFEGPGALAAGYAAAGGQVRYVGKPWPEIYRHALDALDLPCERLVAIGDSLDHDIAGSAGLGIDGALVTGGVHRDAFVDAASPAAMLEALGRLAGARPARPRWLMPGLRPTPRGDDAA